MAYRNKRIAATIVEYERQLADALDVEPVTTGSGKDEVVDKQATKARAQQALDELHDRWVIPKQSWQVLYDTWPEHRKPADMKSEAVAKFRGEDDKADVSLEVKEWSMADKRRNVAEKAEAAA